MSITRSTGPSARSRSRSSPAVCAHAKGEDLRRERHRVVQHRPFVRAE
ncbi:hypothetical protein [Streptomyces sp. NRAIS3]